MKDKYYSAPSTESSGAIVGVAVVIVAAVLSLVAIFEEAKYAFWDTCSIEGLQMILPFVIIIFGAIMYIKSSQYDYKMALFMMTIGTTSAGFEKLYVIALGLIFVSSFAFPFNKRIKYLKHIKTPWICVISAVISALLIVRCISTMSNFEDLPVSDALIKLPFFRMMLYALGFFLIALFQRENKFDKEKNEENSIGQMRLRINSPLAKVGFFLLLADLIFAAIMCREWFGVRSFISLLLCIVALNLMYMPRHNDKFWIPVLLVFVATNLDNFWMYPVYSAYPISLCFFMLIAAIGFKGNNKIGNGNGVAFSVSKIIILVTLLLCLVNQIHMQVNICVDAKEYITPLYKLRVQDFPFDDSYHEYISECQKTLLCTVPLALQTIGLTFIVLFTGIVQTQSSIWHGIIKLYNRFINMCKNFFNRVPKNIMTFAKVWSWIFFVLAIIVSFVTGVLVIADILLSMNGQNIARYVTFYSRMNIWKAVIAIIILLIFAIPGWFYYAYGQIAGNTDSIEKDTHTYLPNVGGDSSIDVGTDDEDTSKE